MSHELLRNISQIVLPSFCLFCLYVYFLRLSKPGVLYSAFRPVCIKIWSICLQYYLSSRNSAFGVMVSSLSRACVCVGFSRKFPFEPRKDLKERSWLKIKFRRIWYLTQAWCTGTHRGVTSPLLTLHGCQRVDVKFLKRVHAAEIRKKMQVGVFFFFQQHNSSFT